MTITTLSDVLTVSLGENGYTRHPLAEFISTDKLVSLHNNPSISQRL